MIKILTVFFLTLGISQTFAEVDLSTDPSLNVSVDAPCYPLVRVDQKASGSSSKRADFETTYNKIHDFTGQKGRLSSRCLFLCR